MKPQKPLKVRVSLTLDGDIVDKLKDMAEYDGRPFSQYVNLVLRSYINKKEQKEPRS